MGDSDGATFTSWESGSRRLDHGRDLYAAVTFDNEPTGRRTLLGWMNNWDYAEAVPIAPWRGGMALPRELALVTVDGVVTLVQRPVRELATVERAVDRTRVEPFDVVCSRVFDAHERYVLDVDLEPLKQTTEFGLISWWVPGPPPGSGTTPRSGISLWIEGVPVTRDSTRHSRRWTGIRSSCAREP